MHCINAVALQQCKRIHASVSEIGGATGGIGGGAPPHHQIAFQHTGDVASGLRLEPFDHGGDVVNALHHRSESQSEWHVDARPGKTQCFQHRMGFLGFIGIDVHTISRPHAQVPHHAVNI